ncbi:Dihydrofolate reductase [Chryseolinea serpens]|uniref:Dihydrofolate reductase n=1 Tax=Chryseolinea serpens TaxID=947013 RepID=A0A1M5JVG1_9BACT|nr:dihydrofolate reductase family protein [Chryseolinea serpens]SHG43993.1 Dihydrofolate reductase [Chryseolinea serpens]
MRKLIVKMSMSLDGFVSDVNGKNDWIFKTGDEQSRDWSVDQIREASLLIMGRTSFEIMSPYWPTATGPFAAPMNTIPKAVFTKNGFAGIPHSSEQSPAAASWSDARIFDGDLAEEIRKLKAEPGKPIVALGGARFIQSLIATGLIDEFNLAIHPVALGSGLPIFAGLASPLYLKLADVETFPGGTIVHSYRAEG